MKNPRVSPAICLPVFLLFIVACSMPTSGGRTGSLVLEISASSSRARTITPTVDIEAASYDISGSGPGGATFGGTGLTGQTHEWGELAPGDWAVTVDARNSSGVRIGTGTRMFAISNGETTTVSLTVSPISGPGTLTVAVSWPATAVASPVVSASLAPQAGAASTIEFTMNGSAASYNNTGLEAGYYTMSLRLFDGSRLVWGRTEAVQIVAGESSAVTYALSLSDVNTEAKGGLALQVFVDLRKPFAVTLTGLLSPIPRQTDMTVTAQAEGTPDSWAWFLNGEPLPGATGPSATLGSTLSAGVYWLDVVASRAGVASSAHGVFRVDSQSAPVTPSVGDLVINEMMIDPAGVADTSGEWFELFNVSAKPLNLEGLVIRTASSFVRLDTGGSGLMIRPGGFLVVSRNGDVAQNGQVKADYVYGTGISLPNASGTLTIASYGTNGMDGAELDAVQWTNAPTGKSLALKRAYASAAGNDVPANWYPSTTSYSATDMGTPGAPNEQ